MLQVHIIYLIISSVVAMVWVWVKSLEYSRRNT